MKLTTMLKFPLVALRLFIAAVIWQVLKHPELAARINVHIAKWPSLHARLVRLAGVGPVLDRRPVRPALDKAPLSPRAKKIYEQLRFAKISERSLE
jgi:hypothetical protein